MERAKIFKLVNFPLLKAMTDTIETITPQIIVCTAPNNIACSDQCWLIELKLLEMTNIVQDFFYSDDEVASSFNNPLLAVDESFLGAAINANEGLAGNHFHDFFRRKVESQSAGQNDTDRFSSFVSEGNCVRNTFTVEMDICFLSNFNLFKAHCYSFNFQRVFYES